MIWIDLPMKHHFGLFQVKPTSFHPLESDDFMFEFFQNR